MVMCETFVQLCEKMSDFMLHFRLLWVLSDNMKNAKNRINKGFLAYLESAVIIIQTDS